MSARPLPAAAGELERPAVGELERRYVNTTFEALCRIESPSGSERACAQRVRAELAAIGLAVHEDQAGARVGGDCGNLLVRIPAAAGDAALALAGGAAHAPASVLLCAHLDTVPPQAPIEPRCSEGLWSNANEGILGADNKAAVAVLLALARRLAGAGSPIDVELLFTVGEEAALAGARALDTALLRSRAGYVFDHASPIGEIVVASPTHFRLDAQFRGSAAHAGIRPEDGRSAIAAAARAIAAMQLGRIDGQSTANVGTITGGSAMNVVPERCSLVAEARSLDERRAEQLAAELVARVHEAANVAECECDVDVSLQRTFAGYNLAPAGAAVQGAERALARCGHAPQRIASGGASDANALIARGIETVNVANGTERNHEPGECVPERELHEMLAVALALVDEAAAGSDAGRAP